MGKKTKKEAQTKHNKEKKAKGGEKKQKVDEADNKRKKKDELNRKPKPTKPPTTGSCSDKKLPNIWSANGLYECDHFAKRSLDYCRHDDIKKACCFCKDNGNSEKKA